MVWKRISEDIVVRIEETEVERLRISELKDALARAKDETSRLAKQIKEFEALPIEK